MNRRFLVGSLFGLSLLAVVGTVVTWNWQRPESPSAAVLSVRRVLPDAAVGDVIHAKRSQPIAFEFDLTNTGQEMLHGLSLHLSCACQIVRKPPDQLAPGETARIGFRLTAPVAGTHEFTAVLRQADRSDPVMMLPCRIQAETTIPGWLLQPRDVQLRFVEGHSALSETVLQTIERRDAAPWLESVTIDPPDLMSITVTHSDDFRVHDPKLCIRKYRVEYSALNLAVGQYRRVLRVRKRAADAADSASVIWTAEVLPRLGVYPNQITLGAGERDTAARVVVVDRAGTGDDIQVAYDSAVLDVRRVSDTEGRSLVFEIRPRATPNALQPTTVAFRAGAGTPGTVNVRVEPRIN